MDAFGQTHWDERFGAAPVAFGDGPDPFLAAQAATLPTGLALLPSDGEGPRRVWLA